MNVMSPNRKLERERSLGKEAVDVVVGDLREGRLEIDLERVFLTLHLLGDLLEDLVELRRGATHTQSDEPQGGSLVEDDHQDDALRHDRDVDVVLFPFVEEDGELL